MYRILVCGAVLRIIVTHGSDPKPVFVINYNTKKDDISVRSDDWQIQKTLIEEETKPEELAKAILTEYGVAFPVGLLKG